MISDSKKYHSSHWLDFGHKIKYLIQYQFWANTVINAYEEHPCLRHSPFI